MDLRTLVNAFMASYQGRDHTLVSRLDFWCQRIGGTPISEIDADLVDAQIAYLAERGALKFVRGVGVVPAGRPLSPATSIGTWSPWDRSWPTPGAEGCSPEATKARLRASRRPGNPRVASFISRPTRLRR